MGLSQAINPFELSAIVGGLNLICEKTSVNLWKNTCEEVVSQLRLESKFPYEFFIRSILSENLGKYEIEDITRWREDMNFMSEILLLPREHKIHIFKLTCDVLFII